MLVTQSFLTQRSHAPLSMEFSRQEHWSGLPFPSPRDLPDPGIEPQSPALQAHSLPTEPPGKRRSFDVLLKAVPAVECLGGLQVYRGCRGDAASISMGAQRAPWEPSTSPSPLRWRKMASTQYQGQLQQCAVGSIPLPLYHHAFFPGHSIYTDTQSAWV